MSKSKVIWKNEEGHIIYCDDGKDYDITKILAVNDQLAGALELAWYLRKENAQNYIAPEWYLEQGFKTAGEVIDKALKAAGEKI